MPKPVSLGAEDKPADGRVLPVRAQDQFEAFGATGAELDDDTVAVFGEFGNGFAEPNRHLVGQHGDEDPCQILPGDLDVLVGVADLVHRHTRDRLPLTVDELAQLGRPNTVLPYLVQNPHLPGYRNRVAPDVDRSALEPEVRRTLHHGDPVALPTEVQCRGETRDTSARNENVHDLSFGFGEPPRSAKTQRPEGQGSWLSSGAGISKALRMPQTVW